MQNQKYPQRVKLKYQAAGFSGKKKENQMDSKAYFLHTNRITEIIRACVWGQSEWCSER